jgi:CRP-like cAMP-binding protein
LFICLHVGSTNCVHFSHSQQCAAGSILYRAGEMAQKLYIILSGRVEETSSTSLETRAQSELTLTHAAGACFGETGLDLDLNLELDLDFDADLDGNLSGSSGSGSHSGNVGTSNHSPLRPGQPQPPRRLRSTDPTLALTKTLRTTDARAVEKCVFMSLSRENFAKFLALAPEFQRFFARRRVSSSSSSSASVPSLPSPSSLSTALASAPITASSPPVAAAADAAAVSAFRPRGFLAAAFREIERAERNARQ